MTEHGRHELPPDAPTPEIGELHAGGIKGVARRGRSQLMFGALAVVLCVLLGIAIVTQARQTESGDSLETARPADLLVLLDSLQQREAALNTEVADLQLRQVALQVRHFGVERGLPLLQRIQQHQQIGGSRRLQ